MSVSKTFPIGAGKLFGAFAQAPRRNRWLDRGTLKVRNSRKGRSIRFDFRDGTSRVVVYFDPKDRNRTTVTVQHEMLADARAVEDMRAVWKAHLKRLSEFLQS